MASTSNKRRRTRYERRFAPEGSETSLPAVIVGWVGALVLGGGLTAQVLAETPSLQTYGPWLLAAGLGGIAVAFWLGDVPASPIRVGDFGFALEQGEDIKRWGWCDVHRVRVEGSRLTLELEGGRGGERKLELPVGPHRRAIAWLLKELATRLPDALDVRPAFADSLPKPRDEDGERVPVEGLQIAGRRCAASEETITFRKDARLCPNCGQLYHREHVPDECVTCGEPVGDRARRP